MSKFKGGVIATTLIFIYLAFGLFLFIGIKGILAQFTASAQTDFRITLKADDRGTELISFLLSENNKTKNIEAIGYFDSSNSIDLSNLEKDFNSIKSIEGKNITLDILNQKKLGEGGGENKMVVDIPLPGGKIGKMEMSV